MLQNNKSIVVCKLPKAGLGNQLFPLMHAFLFAKLNNLPVIVTGYHQLKIGPYIRMEKSKRKYKGYFTFQKNIIGEYKDRLKVKKLQTKYHCIYEPPVANVKEGNLHDTVFIFEKMTQYDDYFVHLKEYRKQVIDLLYSLLTPEIVVAIGQGEIPGIGVHIRMGDFRKLNEGEVFNGGHVRTPEDYYVNTISEIRKLNGSDLKVTVFTDGYKNEFTKLFDLKNIQLAGPNPDIVDLFLISRSKIFITSHGSTFSAWAAFLSDAPILTYFKPFKLLRARQYNEQIYEGVFDESNELLVKQIKNIRI